MMCARCEVLEWLVGELTTLPPTWLDTHVPGLRLDPAKSRIFARLMRSKGKTVGHDVLIAAAECGHFCSSIGTVRSQISMIRRQLEAIEAPYVIHNVSRIGYVLDDA